MELKKWIKKQMAQKSVEPNSALGKAINYLLNRWDKLTRFCHVAGAPLDNNRVERALKIAIRHRKSSQFFKTVNGAQTGGILMTIIETCRQNGIDPFKYLTYIQDNILRVRANPRDFLPWLYHHDKPDLALAS